MSKKKSFPEVSPRFSPKLKRWSDLRLVEKHREIVRCAQRHRGHAVTVNLLPDLARSLHGHERPMRKISKKFNAEMKRFDLRDLHVFLMLEATRETARPHLHGVVIAGSVPMSTIQTLFRNAAGCVDGRSGSRQFQSQQLYAADGWTGYCYKDIRRTKKLLALSENTRLCWVSHSMTRFVRTEYDAVRLGQKPAANSGSVPARRGV